MFDIFFFCIISALPKLRASQKKLELRVSSLSIENERHLNRISHLKQELDLSHRQREEKISQLEQAGEAAVEEAQRECVALAQQVQRLQGELQEAEATGREEADKEMEKRRREVEKWVQEKEEMEVV